MTATERTLRLLRERGYESGIVERFNRYAGTHGIRIDLFNFVDIIAFDSTDIMAVQSCGSSFSEHKKKILANKTAKEWIKVGKIELIGWRKLKVKRGGKKMVYSPRVYEFKEEDFE